MNLDALKSAPRLLLEAKLQPIAGSRFQPTGFPDLGAAQFKAGEVNMLLVESAQSMANRLEKVCWDEALQKPVSVLSGMPYVESTLPDGTKTNSLLEAHRLNSPYIVNSSEFAEIEKKIGFNKNQPFDRLKLAKALLHYDPCSLLHGIFLEKVGGVVRLPRALSAFIEAGNVCVASSGGVKVDRVQPETTGKSTPYGKAKDGYGNVPYHREEFTGDIKAYFCLDLALLRGFGFSDTALEFLSTLAAFKIRTLLESDLRLRTACDLETIGEVSTTRPLNSSWILPATESLEKSLESLIVKLKPEFGPSPLAVTYNPKLAKLKEKKSDEPNGNEEAE